MPFAFPSELTLNLEIFLGILIPVALLNQYVAKAPHNHYLFSYIIGSAIAALTFGMVYLLSLPMFRGNPFAVAIGLLGIVLLWKFLFGPWSSEVKATVLGTFLFWIAVIRLEALPSTLRFATLLALPIAFLPALLWCMLFLKQHRERFSVVILTFLAGMLSTAPILFYDYVVRTGVELDFFLFRLTPEHFMRSSETFASQLLTGQIGIISSSVLASLVSFVLVSVIEEWSKNWVMKSSDRAYFRSIDDAIQLSIIAAIGFAFAENIVNPNYFVAFVRDYLVAPQNPQWGAFTASIVGRAVITNMVHVTSSGVLGYFYGLAFFAQPFLMEDRAEGRRHLFLSFLYRALGVRRATLFQEKKLLEGLCAAIGLHSFFNIVVSLPEMLPGNPNTLGQLFGFSGIGSGITIVAAPALLYVFGGWFLLAYLFRRKESLQEFGVRQHEEVFVRAA
jgi:hypothetical protein